MQERLWYIVQTYSGYENSVKENLERRIQSMEMEDKIFQVMVPEEIEIEYKTDGTKKEKLKKMFPGYVFIEMIVTQDSWFVVRNTPGVTGFLGSSGGGTKPVPLTQDEINPILKKLGMELEEEFEFELDDTVKIMAGPFSGQTGRLDMVDNEQQRVRVLVEFFGRQTPVELSFDQIQKVD